MQSSFLSLFSRNSLLQRCRNNNDFVNAERNSGSLLPEQNDANFGKKTLILDLDETLVHSSPLPIQDPDITLAVVAANL